MTEHHNEIIESVKTGFDLLAIASLAGSLAQIFNPIATIFTIVWMALRIYETRTVQRLLGRGGN